MEKDVIYFWLKQLGLMTVLAGFSSLLAYCINSYMFLPEILVKVLGIVGIIFIYTAFSQHVFNGVRHDDSLAVVREKKRMFKMFFCIGVFLIIFSLQSP